MSVDTATKLKKDLKVLKKKFDAANAREWPDPVEGIKAYKEIADMAKEVEQAGKLLFIESTLALEGMGIKDAASRREIKRMFTVG